MEIIRIPSTYLSQIEYLWEKDKAYVLETLFRLCSWQDIKVQKSLVWWLVISMYREACQMENKARAKKWEKSLEIDIATLTHDTDAPEQCDQVKESNITSSNIKESKEIVSKETELTLKPITQDINNLIQELKQQADTLWIAYDKNKERMFAKHILSAKDYGEFCEKIWMNRIEFAKNIMKASERIKFWKGTCSWPMSIYQNYSDVYNQTKMKIEAKKTTEWVVIYTDEL